MGALHNLSIQKFSSNTWITFNNSHSDKYLLIVYLDSVGISHFCIITASFWQLNIFSHFCIKLLSPSGWTRVSSNAWKINNLIQSVGNGVSENSQRQLQQLCHFFLFVLSSRNGGSGTRPLRRSYIVRISLVRRYLSCVNIKWKCFSVIAYTFDLKDL